MLGVNFKRIIRNAYLRTRSIFPLVNELRESAYDVFGQLLSFATIMTLISCFAFLKCLVYIDDPLVSFFKRIYRIVTFPVTYVKLKIEWFKTILRALSVENLKKLVLSYIDFASIAKYTGLSKEMISDRTEDWPNAAGSSKDEEVDGCGNDGSTEEAEDNGDKTEDCEEDTIYKEFISKVCQNESINEEPPSEDPDFKIENKDENDSDSDSLDSGDDDEEENLNSDLESFKNVEDKDVVQTDQFVD